MVITTKVQEQSLESIMRNCRNALRGTVGGNGMPAHKLERQWWFKISEIDEWLRSGAAADAEDATDGYKDGDE